MRSCFQLRPRPTPEAPALVLSQGKHGAIFKIQHKRLKLALVYGRKQRRNGIGDQSFQHAQMAQIDQGIHFLHLAFITAGNAGGTRQCLQQGIPAAYLPEWSAHEVRQHAGSPEPK